MSGLVCWACKYSRYCRSDGTNQRGN
jgi:hypothetical protein